jgi:hypothetical protein
MSSFFRPSSEALCLIGYYERLRRGGDSGIDYIEPALRQSRSRRRSRSDARFNRAIVHRGLKANRPPRGRPVLAVGPS